MSGQTTPSVRRLLSCLDELLAALSEVVINSLRHGKGERMLSVAYHGAVVCDVTDRVLQQVGHEERIRALPVTGRAISGVGEEVA